MSPRIENNALIMEELRDLRTTVEQLKNCVVQLSSTIKTFKNEQKINEVLMEFEIKKEMEVNFPVRTIAELEELEALAGEDPVKYERIFQEFISSAGGKMERGLKKIISPDVALLYNFNGVYNRRCFNSLKNINLCLFNAVKSDLYTSENYRRACQTALKRIKSLHFKRIAEKSRENQEKSKKVKREYA